MKVMFESHRAFNVNKIENDFFFRGCLFINDKFYTVKEAEALKKLFDGADDIFSLVKEFNGNFLIGIKWGERFFVFQDKIMSFPLYFTVDENNREVVIGDNARVLSNVYHSGQLDKEGEMEAIGFGYTVGNRTFYKEVKLVGPGECLAIGMNDESIELQSYYHHLHRELIGKNECDWLNELDVAVKNTFDRLVRRLSGRQVVLFISGGYDSRLVLRELYKRRYGNVKCISLTASGELDESVGQEISRRFGYECIKFDYSRNYWKTRNNDKKFWDKIISLSNGETLPYYFQGCIVNELVENRMIEANAVVLTGNSGDVVEGDDVSLYFRKGVRYTERQVAQFIVQRFCCNINGNKMKKEWLIEDVISCLPYRRVEGYSFSEAEDIFEYFNWYNRQCKYVTSDVRNYDDWSGNEWALPLWDDEFVRFWLDLPIEYRYKRKLYYKYVQEDNLPTANVESFFMRIRSWLIGHPNNILLPLAYLYRRLAGRIGNSMEYAWGGLVSHGEWVIITKKTLGSRTTGVNDISFKMVEMMDAKAFSDF